MVLHVLTTHLGMFWDAGVYARVLHDWLNGRDPYSLSYSSLLFIYPPVFHWVSGFLVRFLQDIQAGGCKSLFIAGVRSRCLSCLLAFICAVCGWACLLPIYCLPCSSICRPGSAASRKYLRYLLLHRFDRCVAGNEKKPVGAILYNRLLIAVVKVNILILLLMPLFIGQAMASGISLRLVRSRDLSIAENPFTSTLCGLSNGSIQSNCRSRDYGFGVMRIDSLNQFS